MISDIVEPIVKGIARFRRARDSMRGDTSIDNIVKQWREMERAKDEWNEGVSLLTETESALDDFRSLFDCDGMLLRINEADRMADLLDRISEYL